MGAGHLPLGCGLQLIPLLPLVPNQASRKLNRRISSAAKKIGSIYLKDQNVWDPIGDFRINGQQCSDMILTDGERKIGDMTGKDAALSAPIDQLAAMAQIKCAHRNPKIVRDGKHEVYSAALAGTILIAKLERSRSPSNQMRGGLAHLVANASAYKLHGSVASPLRIIAESVRRCHREIV